MNPLALPLVAVAVLTIAAAPAGTGPLSLAHPNGEAARTLIDPVNLDALPLREARKLDGLRVYVVFTIDAPPVEYNTETIAGPESPDPHVERAVHFPTRTAARLERQTGERVRVYGTLRVI
jgi:hypothetical protein